MREQMTKKFYATILLSARFLRLAEKNIPPPNKTSPFLLVIEGYGSCRDVTKCS
jgi:hypothetical protein